MRKIHLLCVVVFLFCFGSQGFAALLIQDNFDSYTPGSLPGDGWSTNNSGALIVIENETYHSSHNSVYMRRTTSGGSFSHLHTSVTEQVTYEAYILSSTNQRETLVMYAGGSGGSGPWLSFGGIAGYLAYYDGSWHNIVAVNSGQWYHVRIVAFVPTHSFDVYVDDMNTPAITGANFRDGGSVTSLDGLSFNVYNVLNPPNTTDHVSIDDVLALTPSAASIPALSSRGMVAFSILAGITAIVFIRRLQQRA